MEQPPPEYAVPVPGAVNHGMAHQPEHHHFEGSAMAFMPTASMESPARSAQRGKKRNREPNARATMTGSPQPSEGAVHMMMPGVSGKKGDIAGGRKSGGRGQQDGVGGLTDASEVPDVIAAMQALAAGPVSQPGGRRAQRARRKPAWQMDEDHVYDSDEGGKMERVLHPQQQQDSEVQAAPMHGMMIPDPTPMSHLPPQPLQQQEPQPLQEEPPMKGPPPVSEVRMEEQEDDDDDEIDDDEIDDDALEDKPSAHPMHPHEQHHHHLLQHMQQQQVVVGDPAAAADAAAAAAAAAASLGPVPVPPGQQMQWMGPLQGSGAMHLGYQGHMMGPGGVHEPGPLGVDDDLTAQLPGGPANKKRRSHRPPDRFPCVFGDCEKPATFAVNADSKPTWCIDHRPMGEGSCVELLIKRCQQGDCKRKPAYNMDGQPPAYCASHRHPSMVNVSAPKCDQCTKRAVFGVPGGKRTRCQEHKSPGMTDLGNRHCDEPGCIKPPQYAWDGNRSIMFCQAHRKEGMQICSSKRCRVEGCKRQPYYGFDRSRPIMCSLHRLPEMEDVMSKRCLYPGCKTQPSYNVEGQQPAYCQKHKQPNMLNVSSKRCDFPNCTRPPKYGVEGTKKALRCSTHKDPHHVNVVHRTCEEPGCYIQPSFGWDDDKGALRCAAHKIQGMIDHKSPKCLQKGCTSRPVYGYYGARPIRCEKHMAPDMVSLQGVACFNRRCRRTPMFGRMGEPPTACIDHKIEGMVGFGPYKGTIAGPPEDPATAAAAPHVFPTSHAAFMPTPATMDLMPQVSPQEVVPPPSAFMETATEEEVTATGPAVPKQEAEEEENGTKDKSQSLRDADVGESTEGPVSAEASVVDTSVTGPQEETKGAGGIIEL